PDERGGEAEWRRLSRPRRELAIKEEQIRAAECCARGENPVRKRDAIARRRFAERIREIAGKKREPEMERPHLGVVQDENVERERQRRRVPELQQRPTDAYA